MFLGHRVLWGSAAIAATAALAGPATASAADYYVDRDVIDISNNCLLATPCDQVSEALALADTDDGSADVVHVGRSSGAYGGVTVPSTPVTLLGGEFNAGADGATTSIDGNASPGVQVASSAFARTVQGFTIEGGDNAGIACSIQDSGGGGTITIQQNLFDEPSAQLDGFICLFGSPVIKDNVVQGSGQPFGIQVTSAISAQITGNTATGAERVIDVGGSGLDGTQNVIDDNTIQVRGTSLSPAAGIYLLAATGDVRGNTVTMDPATTLNQTNGLYDASNSDTDGTLRLARNTIAGFDKPGARAVEIVSPDPVTMSDDLIAENNIGVSDNGNGTSDSLSLTNETIWENLSADVTLGNNPTESVTIDSSILGDTGVVDTSGSTCASSFSRGPASVPFCGPYATNAQPSFVSSSDLHLTPQGNAPFIDMGNPAAPTSATDLDGNTRAIAIVGCPARRDLGAYELATNPLDCTPPASAPPTSPPTSPAQTAQPTKKKCKRKKQRGAAAAKKKCKKKRR